MNTAQSRIAHTYSPIPGGTHGHAGVDDKRRSCVVNEPDWKFKLEMTVLHLLSALVALLGLAWTSNAQGPYPGQIRNLVTFGDSYSDVVGTSLFVY